MAERLSYEDLRRVLEASVARARAARGGSGVVRPDSGHPRRVGADVLVRRVALPFEGEVMEGEVRADPSRLLTADEVGELLEISGRTWRNYVRAGYAPLPVDPDDDRPANRRRPRWSLAQVREYRQDPRRRPAQRPGGRD